MTMMSTWPVPHRWRVFSMWRGPGKARLHRLHEAVFRLMMEVLIKVNMIAERFNRLRKAKKIGR